MVVSVGLQAKRLTKFSFSRFELFAVEERRSQIVMSQAESGSNWTAFRNSRTASACWWTKSRACPR